MLIVPFKQTAWVWWTSTWCLQLPPWPHLVVCDTCGSIQKFPSNSCLFQLHNLTNTFLSRTACRALTKSTVTWGIRESQRLPASSDGRRKYLMLLIWWPFGVPTSCANGLYQEPVLRAAKCSKPPGCQLMVSVGNIGNCRLGGRQICGMQAEPSSPAAPREVRVLLVQWCCHLSHGVALLMHCIAW